MGCGWVWVWVGEVDGAVGWVGGGVSAHTVLEQPYSYTHSWASWRIVGVLHRTTLITRFMYCTVHCNVLEFRESNSWIESNPVKAHAYAYACLLYARNETNRCTWVSSAVRPTREALRCPERCRQCYRRLNHLRSVCPASLAPSPSHPSPLAGIAVTVRVRVLLLMNRIQQSER